ncbi:hypothetical protein EJ05DRAFT_490517 [Pseudovirgaria hyperparasitica]|uniref:Myb-like domain-containing protein n=1 Tax=Pseudovirgaria hyperparasitica TaxID=470096 RepID=A0A6A6VUI7_9PEZI|nr:uncharacterized protein EJ05DRAFT_490517 [Pseudovirgaria hyperparasitica]KAF2752911.1 hypothetical protein EJ05DRAFT_490517 [Pseudovirgaria hyperparasitica]
MANSGIFNASSSNPYSFQFVPYSGPPSAKPRKVAMTRDNNNPTRRARSVISPASGHAVSPLQGSVHVGEVASQSVTGVFDSLQSDPVHRNHDPPEPPSSPIHPEQKGAVEASDTYEPDSGHAVAPYSGNCVTEQQLHHEDEWVDEATRTENESCQHVSESPGHTALPRTGDSPDYPISIGSIKSDDSLSPVEVLLKRRRRHGHSVSVSSDVSGINNFPTDRDLAGSSTVENREPKRLASNTDNRASSSDYTKSPDLTCISPRPGETAIVESDGCGYFQSEVNPIASKVGKAVVGGVNVIPETQEVQEDDPKSCRWHIHETNKHLYASASVARHTKRVRQTSEEPGVRPKKCHRPLAPLPTTSSQPTPGCRQQAASQLHLQHTAGCKAMEEEIPKATVTRLARDSNVNSILAITHTRHRLDGTLYISAIMRADRIMGSWDRVKASLAAAASVADPSTLTVTVTDCEPDDSLGEWPDLVLVTAKRGGTQCSVQDWTGDLVGKESDQDSDSESDCSSKGSQYVPNQPRRTHERWKPEDDAVLKTWSGKRGDITRIQNSLGSKRSLGAIQIRIHKMNKSWQKGAKRDEDV